LGYKENGFVRSVREIAATVQDGIYGGGEQVYPQNYYNSMAASVNDTREFSKVSYNSILKTRDVEDVSTRILTIVRGMADA
jgi:hypothetical protein